MLNSPTNKFLFNLGRQKSEYIIVGIFLSFCSTFLNVISTLLLIPLLTLLFKIELSSSFLSGDNLVKYLFTSFYSLVNQDNFLFAIIIIWVIITIKNIIVYLDSILNIKHNNYLVLDMRNRGLELLSNINIDYYQKNKTRDILIRINQEIDKTALHLKVCQKLFIILSIVFLILCLLASVSWQLTSVFIILFWLHKLTKKRLRNWLTKPDNISTSNSKYYPHSLVDFLIGIRFIKSIGNEKIEYLNVAQILKYKDKKQFKIQMFSAVINPVSEITGTAMILSLVIIGYYLHRVPLQDFTAILLTFLAILLRLFPFLSQLEKAQVQFINSRSSAENIANFLDKSQHDLAKSGTISFSTIDSEIKFVNVTFAYPNHGQIILDKINLRLNHGINTAIVGATETEKAAIIELLLRFYNPIEGIITVNQHDIQAYDLNDWRKSIAIINNDTFLFKKSLAYNIAYGLEDVTNNDLLTVLKQVNLHHLIDSFSQGLATEIPIQDVTLTEVQKQKIAIARAILRKPKFLIINESSLEPELLADPLILEALAQLYCHRTALILTDKLTTLQNADQVVVLHKGMIVESGTHTELMHQGDFYNRWYSKQFQGAQQLHQHKIIQKIAKKLAQQKSSQLSLEINQDFDALLHRIQMAHEATFKSDHDQEKILDESYQSAQELLASLRKYQQKITASLKDGSNLDD